MTTENDLLPLPVGEASSFGNYEVHDNEAMVAYARANIARAVAPLQAEIERLRAEVDALRKAIDRGRTVLSKILENEASDWKAAEEFGGYVLDDELREEIRSALEK